MTNNNFVTDVFLSIFVGTDCKYLFRSNQTPALTLRKQLTGHFGTLQLICVILMLSYINKCLRVQVSKLKVQYSPIFYSVSRVFIYMFQKKKYRDFLMLIFILALNSKRRIRARIRIE